MGGGIGCSAAQGVADRRFATSVSSRRVSVMKRSFQRAGDD